MSLEKLDGLRKERDELLAKHEGNVAIIASIWEHYIQMLRVAIFASS